MSKQLKIIFLRTVAICLLLYFGTIGFVVFSSRATSVTIKNQKALGEILQTLKTSGTDRIVQGLRPVRPYDPSAFTRIDFIELSDGTSKKYFLVFNYDRGVDLETFLQTTPVLKCFDDKRMTGVCIPKAYLDDEEELRETASLSHTRWYAFKKLSLLIFSLKRV